MDKIASKEELINYFKEILNQKNAELIVLINAPKTGQKNRKTGIRMASLIEKKNIDLVMDNIKKLEYIISSIDDFFEINESNNQKFTTSKCKLKINDFVKDVGKNAIEHGWWEEERSFPELIALVHSEASEALEEYRKGKRPDETYYDSRKPEGIPSELADILIRVCDMCNHYGIDLESVLLEKHQYNKTRPYKHGGKVI